MKRVLLAAFAALLLVSPAHAAQTRVALIAAACKPAEATFGGADAAFMQGQVQFISAYLKGLGMDFDIIPQAQAKTEYCRTGTFVLPNGTSKSYGLVVHPSFGNRSASAAYSNVYNPDSMTLTRSSASAGGLPTVPQLCLINRNPMDNATFQFGFTTLADVAACSTGVSAALGSASIPGNGTDESDYGTHEGEASCFEPGFPEVFFFNGYATWWCRNPTAPAGGIRTLLAQQPNDNFLNTELNGHINHPDSVGLVAQDSMVVWTRLMSHKTGAAQMVFAELAAGVYTQDAATPILDPEMITPDPIPLLIALSYCDSICGGTLIGHPLKAAIVVRELLARGRRSGPLGITEADTANFYATLDSLNGLGEPITFAVNTDSASSYARDIIKLKSVASAKFVPCITTGLRDSTAAVGIDFGDHLDDGWARFQRPLDPWGYHRRRTAYGPITRGGVYGTQDSSAYALFSGMFYQCDSIFRNRSLHVGVVPFDDWSPINYEKSDSMLIAFRLAGGVGLIFDGQDTTSYYPRTANPKGAPARDGEVRNGVRLLAHGGFSRTGCSQWFPYGACEDSVFPRDTCAAFAQTIALQESHRFWHSLSGLQNLRDGGWINGTDGGPITGGNDGNNYNLHGYVAARIAMFHAQDLSGNASVKTFSMQPTGAPTRPGWYAIKHMVNAARIMNRFSRGRTIRFTYPDNLP